MGAPIPPMHPSWAQGFERSQGRPPTQGDWESWINRQRNGGVEEPTTASQVGQFAGPVGTVAGSIAASYIPSLFAPSAAATAGTTAGATGAGIAGTTAATTGATAAGTTAATTAASPGIYGTMSAAAPVALPVAAALVAAYNTNRAYEASKGKSVGEMFSDEIKKPRSWISPISLMGGVYGSVFGGRRTREEEQKWRALGEQGYSLPDWVFSNQNIGEEGAWSRPDLAPDFIGKAPTAGDALGIGATPEGTWVNNKFATSRDEADLRPEDIWGYASMVERFGPEYMKTSEENRRAIAQKVLDLGLANEHHGTIDIGASEELDKAWKDTLTPPTVDQVKETARRLYNK